MTEAAETRPVDGRRARRDQNRERVVDALLDLYQEGELRPSVADVAERSGVSHRSVFRYFEDLDELYRVAIQRQFAAIDDLWMVPEIGQGALGERVDRLVEQRLKLYDVAAPVARVGRMRAPLESVLSTHLERMAAGGVDQMRTHFAAELSRAEPAAVDALAEAAGVGCSMEAMEVLRHVRGLDRPAAGAAMAATLRGLFSDR